MQFDPENKVIQLCAEGMNLEGQGKSKEAAELFQQAWNFASNDFEKFTAAHYIARHQSSTVNKLEWDEKALQLARTIDDNSVKGTYPSLYLNVAKCYEDLNDFQKAKSNYELALNFVSYLPADGYGDLIKSGIENGLRRIQIAQI